MRPGPARDTGRRRRLAVGGVAGAVVLVAAAAGVAIAAASGDAADPAASYPRGSLGLAQGSGSQIQLGAGGFTVLPSPASQWVDAHPDDPRTTVIRERVAAEPAALWLTGEESYGNLSRAVDAAGRDDGTLTLTLYNIPGRDDGLSAASDLSAAQYRSFVDRVVTTLGSTRAVVVVEPDALWFVDRQTPPGTAAYTERMASLRYVVDTFRAKAPRAYLYLEAGTSSQSVTPERMAELLQAAGVEQAAGFAVNVSSFGPDAAITAWAQGIRSGLADLGVSDAHYVVDTSRNGNPDWDFTWCNPPGRTVGSTPGLRSGGDGLDADLWIKQPGTSDGDCGVGPGSDGGQFLPQVAYDQVS